MQPNKANDQPVRLHIGGMEPQSGWKILDIKSGPAVDYVGDCRDLSQFSSNSVDEIYASHVLEHLDHASELQSTLRQMHRILVPGGVARISVPDFELLCRMFISPGLNMEQRYYLMRVVFGGQTDAFDYHKIGLSLEFLSHFLATAGFTNTRRVEEFGMFNDCSAIRVSGRLISLNVVTEKPL